MVETMVETKAPTLTKIQNELHAPKGQYNSFGKYKYRSAEDIESALKPLLLKYNAELFITEGVKEVGGRIYIEETIHYKDPDLTDWLLVTGLAREPLNKKGMDESQLTGATSSYATKYALGKLFLIDDEQDADSMNNNVVTKRTAPKPTQSKPSQTDMEKAMVDRAKEMTITYGNKNVKLIDLVHKAHEDEQAKLYLEKWVKQDDKNKKAVDFIVSKNL